MGFCLRKRLLLEKPPPLKKDRILWIHCASVGEFNTVSPLLRELKKDYGIVLTYFSPRAKDYLSGKKDLYDVLFPLPLDIPPIVRSFERMIEPTAILVVEREFWISLLKFTRSKKILLNAYARGNLLERCLASYFSLVITRTEEDREVFEKEGAKRTVACGNLKAVQYVGEVADVHIPRGYRLFVGGSTREGEEEILLKAYLRLRTEFSLKLVLAPRHIRRARDVKRLAESFGLLTSLRSSAGKEWDVLVLDTLGELKSFYAKADVTFVGGTLTPVGGHNLLEPALLGKPVLFGPHTEKVRDLEELLTSRGYGFRVRSWQEILNVARSLLSEGFSPEESLGEYADRVKACYLRELRRELEQLP